MNFAASTANLRKLNQRIDEIKGELQRVDNASDSEKEAGTKYTELEEDIKEFLVVEFYKVYMSAAPIHAKIKATEDLKDDLPKESSFLEDLKKFEELSDKLQKEQQYIHVKLVNYCIESFITENFIKTMTKFMMMYIKLILKKSKSTSQIIPLLGILIKKKKKFLKRMNLKKQKIPNLLILSMMKNLMDLSQ